MSIATTLATVFFSCASPQFQAAAGLDAMGNLNLVVADAKGAVLQRSELKGRFNGSEWRMRCKEARCGLEVDLRSGVGELWAENVHLDFGTIVTCD